MVHNYVTFCQELVLLMFITAVYATAVQAMQLCCSNCSRCYKHIDESLRNYTHRAELHVYCEAIVLTLF